jgi:hypothetical protein
MPPWGVIVLMAVAVAALAVYLVLINLYPIPPAR